MRSNVLAVVTEATPRGLTDGGREALGFALRLAGEIGGTVTAVLLESAGGAAAAEAAELGAAHVFTLMADEQLPRGTALLAGAASVAARVEPGVIVVSRSPHALEVAPRLAARLGGGSVLNVTEVELVDGGLQAVAAIYGGAARAVYRLRASGPGVLVPAAGAAEAPPRDPSQRGAIETLSLSGEGEPAAKVVAPARVPEGPRLEEAPIVVSGGRGLRERENYVRIRELAAALRGMPGASRAIVDDGWALPAEQVGLTGKIVSPQLYFAIGISGASQHLAGCANARTLVAINTDPEAPIFKYAEYGIVDDCLAVLPELIRLAQARSGRG